MPMFNLIEYSDNYLKKSGSLWQYYRDESHATITDSESFKSIWSTPSNSNTKDVEIAVSLKHLSNF